MATPVFSPSWYRVAQLKPRLRAHVTIHRQTFRGTVWHVVQDDQTGRFHRLSTAAYHVVCLMDGQRSVEDIWTHLAARLGPQQPTQEEVVRLLSMLHATDLIIGGVSPHMDELDERSLKQARKELLSRIRNPLAIRLRLVDPDRALAATMPLLRPLFSPWGLFAWIVLVVCGGVLTVLHWGQMTGAVFDTVFTAQNILLIALIYPVVKLLHELGHAYAVKVWGGEVHELGVMLLALMPVPYVDASASIAFPERGRRAVVGAAGIMVELALASLAVMVWVAAEPGIVRAIALNVALTCGVSTLLFNGNPLLRFDGYYVLSDWLEIPNLAQRANRHVLYLVQRHAFGLSDLDAPLLTAGEGPILVVYAFASFVYRTLVMLGVALFVASHFFIVGVLLALASIVSAVIWPVLKGLHFVLLDARVAPRRPRALAVSAGMAAFGCIVLFAVPLPYATMAEGVVWVSDDEATVRVRSAGLVAQIQSDGAAEIAAGAPVLRLEDPILTARTEVASKELEELRIKLDTLALSDRVAGNVLREQVRHSEAKLAEMQRNLDELLVRAPRSGRLLMVSTADLLGRFQRKGDVVGYIVSRDGLIVRAVVPQDQIDLVRRKTVSVAIRLASDRERTLSATVERDVPAALAELPHGALSTLGGGAVLLDPARGDKLKPLDSIFQLDLRAADLPSHARLGMRAHVRFEHPAEPVALRLYRAARQLFLRQLHV